ncbi:hypothetical protein GL263_18745, partial [Streptomyces durbertensis]
GRVCWGGLDRETVDALLPEEKEGGSTRVEELTPRKRHSWGADWVSGRCRVDRSGTLTVALYPVGNLRGEDGSSWAREHLNGEAVPLGDGVPGMVSPGRAWVLLPDSCVAKAGEDDRRVGAPSATAVTVEVGGLLPTRERRRREDGALQPFADAVVDAANATMAYLGCAGRYQRPGELAEAAGYDDVGKDALCGIEGLPAGPVTRRDSVTQHRMTDPDGALVRTCEVLRVTKEQRWRRQLLRLTTIEDDRLEGLFRLTDDVGGRKVTGKRGEGWVLPGRAVYRAECQTGMVTFVLTQEERWEEGWLPGRYLAPYVEAESRRLGCGELAVRRD